MKNYWLDKGKVQVKIWKDDKIIKSFKMNDTLGIDGISNPFKEAHLLLEAFREHLSYFYCLESWEKPVPLSEQEINEFKASWQKLSGNQKTYIPGYKVCYEKI